MDLLRQALKRGGPLRPIRSIECSASGSSNCGPGPVLPEGEHLQQIVAAGSWAVDGVLMKVLDRGRQRMINQTPKLIQEGADRVSGIFWERRVDLFDEAVDLLRQDLESWGPPSPILIVEQRVLSIPTDEVLQQIAATNRRQTGFKCIADRRKVWSDSIVLVPCDHVGEFMAEGVDSGRQGFLKPSRWCCGANLVDDCADRVVGSLREQGADLLDQFVDVLIQG